MLHSRKEKESLLQMFPEFELSYEKIVHKKVFKDIFLAIPKGKKYFAWFTYYKSNPMCFILEKKFNQCKIVNIEYKLACFDESLCLGTIVYGTIIEIKQHPMFVIEDIYYYKNKYIGNYNLLKKLDYFDMFFNLTKQAIYGKNFIVFGMCLMSGKYKELMSDINEVNYDIYSIQHRSLYNLEPYLVSLFKENKRENIATFKVKAENQNDIYSLYCYDRGEKLYDSAYVSNYDISVFLNSLFRNIKENINLDALEESDEEQEFENVNEDKYVLNKTYIMDCKYYPKFKKWEPFRISKQRKLISLGELKNI